jgi:hypothetical protein
MRSGAAAVLTAGLAWAALCTALAEGGHAPSMTMLPITRGQHYRLQAFYVIPLLVLLHAVCVIVCAWVAQGRLRRALGAAETRGSVGPLGLALAGPLLLGFILPDAVAYGLGGFQALGRIVRVTAPLTFVTTIALAALVVRATHGVSAARACVSAAAGVLALALIGGPFLR